jgi:hypothetical protein
MMGEPHSPSRLKLLLQQRHLQTHAAFCVEYDKTAKVLEERLVGSHPSRAQFHRWLSGAVKGRPHPYHCRVLETMFPDWTIDQLFQPWDHSERALRAASQGLAGRNIGQLLAAVDTSLSAPDASPVMWGRDDGHPRKPGSVNVLPSPVSAHMAGMPDGEVSQRVGRKLVELSRMLRLSDAESGQLAGLAGHVVELELALSIDISKNGQAHLLYEHDLVNFSDKPLSRMPREVWFQYTDAPITIEPAASNERRIVIQRIHDTGTLAKFAFRISPPLQPGERTTARYTCSGGSFRDRLYWRQAMPRYTRHYTLSLCHRGAGPLTECTGIIEHQDGAETSVTSGLLWDYDGDDVTVTLAADYLRPGEVAELRWDISRAGS